MAEDQHRGSPVVTNIHPACFLGSTTCLGRKGNKCWPLSPINQKYIHFHEYKSLNTEGKEYVAEMSLPSTPLSWNPSLDLCLSGWTLWGQLNLGCTSWESFVLLKGDFCSFSLVSGFGRSFRTWAHYKISPSTQSFHLALHLLRAGKKRWRFWHGSQRKGHSTQPEGGMWSVLVLCFLIS